MDIQQAIRTIYEAMGWEIVDTDSEGDLYCRSLTGDSRKLFTNPVAETEAGLAEFARVLLWGLSNEFYITMWDDHGISLRDRQSLKGYSSETDKPKEDFLQALAAAIVARGKE